MNSPEQHPVTDEEARRLAKALVRLFRSPLKIFGTRGFDTPVTIGDAIRLGGIFIGAFNVATGDPALKEKTRIFAEKLSEFIYLPEAMEEFLYKRIKERAENEEEILETISQVEEQMAGPGAARRFLKKVMAEVMPKARQGRPTEFNPATDQDRFLGQSAQLIKVCGQFLGLREQFPRKSIKELLVFLQPEDPKGTELLRKYEDYITQTMNSLDFRILKTIESRVCRLADALAGRELFGWSFTYAIQRAGEFRRSTEADPEE